MKPRVGLDYTILSLDFDKEYIWIDIVKQKISNQSRALSIMGLDGAEKIAEYVAAVDEENVDYCESLAAKEYFSYYH